MIVELGPAAHELIRVTSEYSNAVLVAVMPFVSGYAQKLELPVPHPIAITDVYYDDKAYWNHPPKIDVPLTLSKRSDR
jgi:hypothetical protein